MLKSLRVPSQTIPAGSSVQTTWSMAAPSPKILFRNIGINVLPASGYTRTVMRSANSINEPGTVRSISSILMLRNRSNSCDTICMTDTCNYSKYTILTKTTLLSLFCLIEADLSLKLIAEERHSFMVRWNRSLKSSTQSLIVLNTLWIICPG